MNRKVIIFKNKADLDLLSLKEIEAYRKYILQNGIFDWKIYVEELELYTDIRFKDEVITRFDDYRVKANDPNTEEWDKKAMTLITRLQPDSESLYKFFTEGKLKLLQPYKYIAL